MEVQHQTAESFFWADVGCAPSCQQRFYVRTFGLRRECGNTADVPIPPEYDSARTRAELLFWSLLQIHRVPGTVWEGDPARGAVALQESPGGVGPHSQTGHVRKCTCSALRSANDLTASKSAVVISSSSTGPNSHRHRSFKAINESQPAWLHVKELNYFGSYGEYKWWKHFTVDKVCFPACENLMFFNSLWRWPKYNIIQETLNYLYFTLQYM